MSTKNANKYIVAGAILATAGSLATALPAFVQNAPLYNKDKTDKSLKPGQIGTMMRGNGWGEGGRPGMMGRAVAGTVTAVNGTTVTLTAKTPIGRPNATSTASVATVVYSIDASKATVMKNGALSAVSAIAVGDQLLVQGTITGTNIVATKINDGVVRRLDDDKVGAGKNGEGKKMMQGLRASTTKPVIAGNGQPVVAGKVTAVNGNVITITNASSVVYTVDATNAKVAQGNTLSTLASVKVGDEVVAQGTVNGNSIVASSVIDGAKPVTVKVGKPAPKGFFGSIGGFFGKIFGF